MKYSKIHNKLQIRTIINRLKEFNKDIWICRLDNSINTRSGDNPVFEIHSHYSTITELCNTINSII